MIRSNGYYLKPTNKYKDAISGTEMVGFIHWAYLFLDRGIVKRMRKETSDGIASFKKEDFKEAYAGEYSIVGDVLTVIFDKGDKWEVKESFTIKSGREFVNGNQKFLFHEWS